MTTAKVALNTQGAVHRDPSVLFRGLPSCSGSRFLLGIDNYISLSDRSDGEPISLSLKCTFVRCNWEDEDNPPELYKLGVQMASFPLPGAYEFLKLKISMI